MISSHQLIMGYLNFCSIQLQNNDVACYIRYIVRPITSHTAIHLATAIYLPPRTSIRYVTMTSEGIGSALTMKICRTLQTRPSWSNTTVRERASDNTHLNRNFNTGATGKQATLVNSFSNLHIPQYHLMHSFNV